MTPDEFRKCGLQKLNSAELEALNQWIVKTLVTTLTATPQDSSEDEIALYDGDGTPEAYIATSEDANTYTWSGKPEAYLDGDSIYGFNRKHLGCRMAGFTTIKGELSAQRRKSQSRLWKPERVKAVKQITPLKSIKSLAPLQPIHSLLWSQTPLLVFLSQGAK